MTTITIDRATVEQALADLKDLHKNHNITYAGTIAALEAALAQQAEPVQDLIPPESLFVCDQMGAHVTRVRLAQQAEPVEPVAWVHTDAHNPKVRFLEWTQQAKGYRGDWIKTPLCNCAPPRQSDPQIEDRLARHGITGDPK